MSDLRLIAAILSIIEITAWLAVISTLPLSFMFFETLPQYIAIISTIGYFLSALAYVAVIRTGRAIVIIAQNTSDTKMPTDARSGRKVPKLTRSAGRGAEPPLS